MLKFAYLPQCASYEELALRLWYNFRWKGFLHPAFNYTYLDKPDASKDDVKGHLESQLHEAMEAGLKEPELLKKTKRDFRKACFRSLSDAAFSKYLHRHSLDVQLFGFEKERAEVVSWIFDNKKT